ncbi:hypothetical protein [Priestia megaterium]|uniref:hypothetical protein n=1 Tax=Priestia megaterium TaxID=1404 RepID=UPI00211D11AC|nr:hypothetical protein [Priestia megaterium]
MPKGRTQFEECEFVGEGQEDIIDILKRQFVRYINQEKGFPYLGLEEKSNKNQEKTE